MANLVLSPKYKIQNEKECGKCFSLSYFAVKMVRDF